MARKSSPTFRPLNYKHSISILHANGRALTTLVSDTSLNTWTRNRRNVHGEGVTVRVDNAATHRFTGVVGVQDNRS
jgi:hypothetical protein